ncbi:fumarylacetoacetate hydrolase family protein [Pendulispora rubella]|uniref:Fumarylacetoacetate hydrolase family protein n=1 Tax=Pendulispora rubella TaxID=2741070 RepID=A0ABZ2LJR6_9BACT
MKLVTIDSVRGGAPGALLASGEVLHLGKAARAEGLEAWLPSTMRALLAGGVEGANVVRRILSRVDSASEDEKCALRARGIITDARTPCLAPVPDPSLILAAGLSYRSHLREMHGTPAPPHPTAFLKAPSSVAAPESSLRLPPQAPNCVDFEGELACIFDRPCHHVSREDALSYVAGYTAANDISARDWVGGVWSATEPWPARLSWEVNIMGKQMPGFTPLGPVLTTADEIPDPRDLQLVTRVNGVIMQSAPVSDLLFELAEMIAHFSHWYTFQPGDVLLTGTPAGVGVGRTPRAFLRAGDIVEVEISQIGILRTHIAA